MEDEGGLAGRPGALRCDSRMVDLVRTSTSDLMDDLDAIQARIAEINLERSRAIAETNQLQQDGEPADQALGKLQQIPHHKRPTMAMEVARDKQLGDRNQELERRNSLLEKEVTRLKKENSEQLELKQAEINRLGDANNLLTQQVQTAQSANAELKGQLDRINADCVVRSKGTLACRNSSSRSKIFELM